MKQQAAFCPKCGHLMKKVYSKRKIPAALQRTRYYQKMQKIFRYWHCPRCRRRFKKRF